MIPPVSASSAARLEEIWKRIGAVLEARGAAAVADRRGRGHRHGRAGSHAVSARAGNLGAHRRRSSSGESEPGEIPEPLPEGVFLREGELWMPLCAEGETARPPSRARRVARSSTEEQRRRSSAFLFGSLVARAPPGAPGPRRRVRAQGAAAGARVPLRPRPLARPASSISRALADEVLFRSISLTDAGQGHARAASTTAARPARAQRRRRAPRSRGTVVAWELPEGGLINNGVCDSPTDGMR